MRTVGLKVLKNRLSECVRLAASGETVLVADRDHVVAELGPPRTTRALEVADAQLAQLVRRGVIQPALLPPGTRPRVPSGMRTTRLTELLRELDADRAER